MLVKSFHRDLIFCLLKEEGVFHFCSLLQNCLGVDIFIAGRQSQGLTSKSKRGSNGERFGSVFRKLLRNIMDMWDACWMNSIEEFLPKAGQGNKVFMMIL